MNLFAALAQTVQEKAVPASVGGLATFLGLTLAQVEIAVRIGVGCATFVLIVLGCAVKWKELRRK